MLNLKKSDLQHLLDAYDDAILEFEELTREQEWYVTDVVDKLASAREIVLSAIAEVTHDKHS